MKNTIKKSLLALSALLVTVFCLSGCMATTSNVKFNWNGSIDYTVNYQISPQIFTSDETGEEDAQARTDSYLASIKEEVEACTPATFVDTSNDEYTGLQFTASFADVNAMTQSGIAGVVSEQIPAPVVGEGEGVNIHLYVGNHGLYRTYQLLGEIPADILGLNAQMPQASESGQSIYNITFSATAPLKLATKSNATKVEGSTYTWESDSNSAAIPVEFTTNVPSVLGFIVMAVVLLAIIALIVLLIVKLVKKSPSDEALESVTGAMENAEAAFYGDGSESNDADAATETENTAENAVDTIATETEEAIQEVAEAEENPDSDTTL